MIFGKKFLLWISGIIRSASMDTIYLLLLLLAIATNLFLILVLLLRKERSLSLTCFIFFLSLIVVWAIPQFIINFLPVTSYHFTHLNRISALGYTFIPVAFLLFTISFSGRAGFLRKYVFLSLVFIPAFVFLYFSWTTNLIVNHTHTDISIWDWGISSSPGFLFPLFLSWFEILMIMSLFVLISVFRNSMDFIKKRQSIWLLFATLIPLSIGTITDGILPLFGMSVFPLAVPLTTIMSGVITYAIFKYDLFDFSDLSIVSSIGDGLITVDATGKIMVVNESAEEILGVKKKDLLGKDIYKKIKMFDGNNVGVSRGKRPLYLAMHGKKQITSNDYFVESKRNRKFAAAFSIAPVITDEKVVGATVNFRDISKEKELEKSKDEFISIASHELKTPITALKLYTQLLEKQLGKEKNYKYLLPLSKISSQTDRLIDLVGDLLNISRLQTGKFVYNKKPIYIAQLINYSLLNVKPSVKGRKIVKKIADKALVLADKGKVSQVITNLIINAAKYSPPDKEIIITSRHIGKNVIFSVKDFGIGIPRSKQRKIFNKYFQVENRERNIPGLGIGLYVSSEIVKSHNGKIWVVSSKGKGSTFSFSLPIYTKKS